MKLRAAFVRACWSSKLTLAHTGTVLGMSGGPECVDPCACIVWYRFRLLRRYLAYRPLDSARIGKLLDLVSNVAPGHEPLHLLVDSAASLEFRWCPDGFCLSWPVLPRMPMLEGPYRHFKASILNAWRDCNAILPTCAGGRGFGVARSWIFRGPCSSLTLPMLGIETRHCLEGSFLVEFGMVFPLARYKGITFHVVFVGVWMGDGHLFWECSHPSPSPPPPHPVAIRESPEFHYLSTLIKLAGLDAFFGTVGYQLCLVLILVILGLLWLLMLLLSGWRSRLALMLERARSLVMSFLWLEREPLLLTHLMSGLVGVWC